MVHVTIEAKQPRKLDEFWYSFITFAITSWESYKLAG